MGGASQRIGLYQDLWPGDLICSTDFKTLVYRLRDRDCRRFVLDLTECPIMDSTFLGILARFGLTLSNEQPAGSVQIVNPNERILRLLESLGVEHLFEVIMGPAPSTPDGATPLDLAECNDKREAARTSLEAHETLSQLSPENAARFKDVIRFLAEDLEGQQGKSAPTSPA